jgi:hypothetical protein
MLTYDCYGKCSEKGDGIFVLKTDHLAEVEQWKRVVVLQLDVIAEKEREIAYNQRCYNDAVGEYHLEEQDLRKQIAALQDKINQYINKASYFIGTSDGLESDACIDIALKHASTLRQELQDERVQIAALTAELSRLRAEKRDEYCQGCALPERVKELKAVLREQTLLTNDKVKRIKELEALSIIDHKTIHTQQQRIKELEFYLDQLPAHARAEKKDEYCQGCALPERVKELEGKIAEFIYVESHGER